MKGLAYRLIEEHSAGERTEANIKRLAALRGGWQLHFRRDPVTDFPAQRFYHACPSCWTDRIDGPRNYILEMIERKDAAIGHFLALVLQVGNHRNCDIWVRTDGIWGLVEGEEEMRHFPLRDMTGHELLEMARLVESGAGPISPCEPSHGHSHG